MFRTVMYFRNDSKYYKIHSFLQFRNGTLFIYSISIAAHLNQWSQVAYDFKTIKTRGKYLKTIKTSKIHIYSSWDSQPVTIKLRNRALNTFSAPAQKHSEVFKSLWKANRIGAILISKGRIFHRAGASAENGHLLVPASNTLWLTGAAACSVSYIESDG